MTPADASRGWTFARWAAIAALAWALVLVVALSGCTPPVVVRPDPLACALRPPPPVVGYPSSCTPHVCLSDDDARALAAEVGALRAWARGAYVACPHVPATEGKMPKPDGPPRL